MTTPIKITDIRIGDRVVVDGFDCMKDGEILEVDHDETQSILSGCAEAGFYVRCKNGRHFLDGQDDGTGTLIGFSRVGAA